MLITSLDQLTTEYSELRLILGDQLNASHSWYRQVDSKVLHVICELHQEAEYTRHHTQKITAFFLAMQSFAQALSQAGHHVLYLTLDDTVEYATLPKLLDKILSYTAISSFRYQQPDEYRLADQLNTFCHQLTASDLQTTRNSSEHFLLEQNEFTQYLTAGKANRMEAFYRKLRQRFNILMNGDGTPEGGQWNFDQANRNKLSNTDLKDIPSPLLFSHATSEIHARLKRHKIHTLGKLPEHLIWPVTRQEAKQLLVYFCTHLLPNFGRFQDSMTCQSEHQWSLYHSRLSFALNAKLISPSYVIDVAIDHYRRNQETISLAQIEGFVRQILGWREYIRAIYWLNMPDYQTINALSADRPLPHYFWNGHTKMRCMSETINQSLEHSYAHHIQRLMITGNFCLLTGISPNDVDDWYLGIYIDAIEWVELPNTRGMSLFADGGWIASKPYAASANYIQKMSDYCSHCYYQAKLKIGDKACPFNSLYWHFMIQHRTRFETNPRIGMIYRNWQKQSEEQQNAVLEQAKFYLNKINAL